MARIDQNGKGLVLTFCAFLPPFQHFKTVQKGIKPPWQWQKNIANGLAFVLEPFLKS